MYRGEVAVSAFGTAEPVSVLPESVGGKSTVLERSLTTLQL
jgi:hypothetical protein